MPTSAKAVLGDVISLVQHCVPINNAVLTLLSLYEAATPPRHPEVLSLDHVAHSSSDGDLDFLMAGDSSLHHAAGELYWRFTDPGWGPRLERMTAQLEPYLEVLKHRVSEVTLQECTELQLFGAGGSNVVYLALLKDESDVLLRVMPDMQSERWRLLGILQENVASHECEVRASHFSLGSANWFQAKGVSPNEVLERSYENIEKFVAQLADFDRQLRESPFPAIGSLRATALGPFKSSKALALAYIDSAVDQLADEEVWMTRRQVAAGKRDAAERLPKAYMQTYLALLKEGVEELPGEPESFRLIYYDTKPENMLLRGADDATITAIFDWQGAIVAPSWATSGFHTHRLSCYSVGPDEARDQALEAKYFPHTPEPFPWRELIELLERNPAYCCTKEGLDSFVREWKLPDEHVAGFLALQAFVGPV
ncbi:hypothetical protein FB45DRAFT_873598 [Roridomyces roridus]|uniref:Aminoglycoside phosphotransferase domain-containing protein n=1 Tax=Roridomyces roridus TaxID=1738132 RepID=A0AAD7FFG2_9AGAR|nr:hypothetical protein FB45DRAFT_873598 [Roridomyces roridus]